MPITGDLFLQLISIRTDALLRDVAVLDAYFFLFLLAGIALLYATLPRPLVVRPPPSDGAPASLNGRWGPLPPAASTARGSQHALAGSDSGCCKRGEWRSKPSSWSRNSPGAP